MAVAMSLGSGCAVGPVVRWDTGVVRPGNGDSSAAMAYLQAARSGYRNAVADQLGHERGLSNAILGAGLLVVGLAAGGVHRDAILGASALGSAGYLVGTQNLPRSRVAAYQAGVDALNCAEKAFVPYIAGADEIKALKQALEGLAPAKVELDAAVAKARATKATLTAGSSEIPLLESAITLGEQVASTVEAAANDANGFIAASARASRELVVVVDKVDAAVVKALITSTPDLSAVLKSVGGISGVIGAFAPQAGLESFLASALKDYDKSGAPVGTTAMSGPSGKKKLLSNAEERALEVREAAVKVTILIAVLQRVSFGRVTAWSDEEIKACAVTAPVVALSLSTTDVALTAGTNQRRFVDIIGGVRPYFVEIDGAALDGVDVRAPRRGDNRIELVADGSKLKAGAKTALRVSDSAPESTALSVNVAVQAAKPASDPPAAAASAAAATPAAGATNLLPWKTADSVTVDGNVVGRIDGEPTQDAAKVWSVQVNCEKPTTRVAESKLRGALAAAAKPAIAATAIRATTLPPECKTPG